ncbi:MAG: LacI family DNA-binding transcriptional regulator [Phycisphaeraceae bacterium]
MKSQPPTLRQVAKQANVSVAAISYVLNGKGRISDRKRNHIVRLLQDAGLKPKYKHRPIFHLCDHRAFSTHGAFAPMVAKYEALNAISHEYEVSLRLEFLHSPGSGDLAAQLAELQSYHPGAVVLDSLPPAECPTIADYFERRGVPTVQIGYTVAAPGIDAVVIDDFAGAYEATRHLIGQGHQKIATLRWNIAGDSASPKKHAGFLCALEEAGLPVRPQYIVESPFKRVEDRLTGREAAAKLLTLADPPTAVFVENSFISASLLYPSNPSEPALPDAIARLDMVHFEAWDLELVEQVMTGILAYPARRTKLLKIDWSELAKVAAKQLIERMRGQPNTGRIIRMAPRLYEVNGVELRPLTPSATSATPSMTPMRASE